MITLFDFEYKDKKNVAQNKISLKASDVGSYLTV
jgi:hypothetical protein